MKASLRHLTLSLVTGPTKTFDGSFGVVWIASFLLSLKGFILKSSPTSNKDRSLTLNIALTSYLLDRFIL